MIRYGPRERGGEAPPKQTDTTEVLGTGCLRGCSWGPGYSWRQELREVSLQEVVQQQLSECSWPPLVQSFLPWELFLYLCQYLCRKVYTQHESYHRAQAQ